MQPEPEARADEPLFEVDPQRLLHLRISPELPEKPGLRTLETMGLSLALLESGLAEVRHVLPVVAEASPSPGVDARPPR